METLLKNWQLVALILGSIIAGILALWGVFDQRTKQRRKEIDDQEDRLISLYKGEIDQLKKNQADQDQRINEMSQKYEEDTKELIAKIARVNGENEIMKALLEGRDKTSLEFQRQGFAAIKRSERMEKVMNGGFRSINENIERLAQAIEKHLKTQEAIIKSR